MRRQVLAIMTALLVTAVQQMGAQAPASLDRLMASANHKATVDGDLRGAIADYADVVARAGANRAVAAQALLRMAEIYDKLGDAQAQVVYQRVVRDFADQTGPASTARARVAAVQAQIIASRVTASEAWRDLDNVGARGALVSADGRYMGLTFRETGDVAIRDVATGSIRRLTQVTSPWAQGADETVISPDGQQIAYRWMGHPGEPEQLRVSAARDGAVPRVLFGSAVHTEYIRRVSWTPDGRRLVVLRSRLNESQQLGVVTVADGSYHSIKSLDWREAGLLSVSPDGRYVAYDVEAGEAGSPRNIFILALDGSSESALRNQSTDVNPVWSADGSHLFFFSDRSGTNGLWAVPVRDGRVSGAPVLIKADVGTGATQMAGTSRDDLYYFVPSPARVNLYAAELTSAGVATTTRATSRFADATFGHWNFDPAWSKDGALLAYLSSRIDAQQSQPVTNAVLVIRTMRTGEERTIPLPPGAVVGLAQDGPKWLPDGRSVVVMRDDSGGRGFYRMSVDTGNTELLARARAGNVFEFDLSPDGRTIFYGVSNESGTVVRLDIATERETVLKVMPPAGVLSLAVSPDGTQLAIKRIGGGIEIMPANGGPSREVRPETPGMIETGQMRNGMAWTPDQRFLLVTLGNAQLWRIATADGSAEKLDIPLTGLRAPAVHPDGRRVVFSSTQGVNAGGGIMWKIENPLAAIRSR